MAQKVLVVDDDLLMLAILQRYLERSGYQVLVAKNGVEGIEVAEREMPKLIVMDVMMPEMTGLDAMRHLKETDGLKEIPIIIIATSDSSTLRDEAALCGAAAFLTKPFGPAQLLAEITRLVPAYV